MVDDVTTGIQMGETSYTDDHSGTTYFRNHFSGGDFRWLNEKVYLQVSVAQKHHNTAKIFSIYEGNDATSAWPYSLI